MSANVTQEVADQYAAAGMDDFLGKPALADKLRRWLAHLSWSGGESSDPVTPAAGDRGNGSEAEDVIHRAVLDDVTGGDRELAAGLLLDYVDSLHADLAEINSALADATAEVVRRTAHRRMGQAEWWARTTSTCPPAWRSPSPLQWRTGTCCVRVLTRSWPLRLGSCAP